MVVTVLHPNLAASTWISPSRAANRAGVCGQTIRNWIALGRLPAVRTQLGHLVDPVALQRLIAERDGEPVPAA